MLVSKTHRHHKSKPSERADGELEAFHGLVEQIGKLELPPFNIAAERAACNRFERCYQRASYVRHRLKTLSLKDMREWMKDYTALQLDIRDMRIASLAAEIRRRERKRR